MKESGVVQCSWLEDLQYSIEEPWESQGGVKAGAAEEKPGVRDDGGGGGRGKNQQKEENEETKEGKSRAGEKKR